MTPLDAPPQYLIEDTYKIAPAAPIGSQTSHYKPFEFRVRLNQAAADWLNTAIADIQDLTALAQGWDSYGAQPVDAEAAMDAVMLLLHTAYPSLASPSIVPVADGGVQIEWHRGGVDLEILFSDGHTSVFMYDHESGETIEDQEGNPAAQIRRLADRLAA